MNYWPEELAPKKAPDDAKEPFQDWWRRVRSRFPNIPADVGEQWLYDNWGSSPYGYLISQPYRFDVAVWDSARLAEIRERTYDWEIGGEKSENKGRVIIRNLGEYEFRTARYLVDHLSFPRPIIVLDNRDGHLRKGIPPVPESENLPASYLLIEGHRRFQMGLYLQSMGKLNPTVELWIMTAGSQNA
ncbi:MULTISPECIES: hypothetical protein [Microvirga]|uniref:hypothetical protein n=1 Tax=Microvirga TaxID=186650 RepID=UPI0021C95363|nr:MULTISPECIES: hypothetical protein [unclassified Microvirga]